MIQHPYSQLWIICRFDSKYLFFSTFYVPSINMYIYINSLYIFHPFFLIEIDFKDKEIETQAL